MSSDSFLSIVEKNEIEKVKMMLNQSKCHLKEVEPQNNKTALHIAAECGHDKLMKILIDAGADVNVRSSGGLSPLHYAVKEAKLICVEILLKKEASVTARDICGKTCLHTVADIKDAEPEIISNMIEILLNAKADPKALGYHSNNLENPDAVAVGTKTPFDLINQNNVCKHTKGWWRLRDATY